MNRRSAVTLVILAVFLRLSCKVIASKVISKPTHAMSIDSITKQDQKMKVEIWSDVVCPFCYIGKTKFEETLNKFAEKNNIEVEWKSYQLMPDVITQQEKNIDQILSETKGISIEQAKQMNAQAALMGKQAGLQYNFDKAIVANTFKAHQFIHYAKSKGKQMEAEELMFKSYFTDGKNIDDIPTLLELGKSIGLNTVDLKQALESQTFAKDVKSDISQAQNIGVRGVPFFLFNGKYAVSGAQDSKVFLEALEKSYNEWENNNNNKSLEVNNGALCSPNKECR